MNAIHVISLLLLILLLPSSLLASSVEMFLTSDELYEIGICIEPPDYEVEGATL